MTNKTKRWFVVHDDEGLLSELNTKWDQVELQTFLKLEPCFMFTSAEGNNATGALSPASQSQDLALQVRDNEGTVGNEQAFDLSTHSFTVSQQPSTQPPVASQPVSDMSLHSSPDAQPVIGSD